MESFFRYLIMMIIILIYKLNFFRKNETYRPEEELKPHQCVPLVETPGIKALRAMIAFLYMPPFDKKGTC